MVSSAAHVSCSKKKKKSPHPSWTWASYLSCRLLSSHCCLIVAHKHKVAHDNNLSCIIVWKKCLHDKVTWMFWDFFFSFVYDTSLEMCLNRNVLSWNLRDICFLYLLVLVVLFLIIKLLLLHPLGWVSLVFGWSWFWDWSFLGSLWLKLQSRKLKSA